MTTAKKKKFTKTEQEEFDKNFDIAIAKAQAAKPHEIKVTVSCRMDSDIYMELHRRADIGEGQGMYQRVMMKVLREALFAEKEKEQLETERAVLETKEFIAANAAKPEIVMKLWAYIKENTIEPSDLKRNGGEVVAHLANSQKRSGHHSSRKQKLK